jgi:hypothetical protein
MRDARRWGIPTELGFDAVGPREDASSFAHEWWGWWKLLQPKTRVNDSAHGLTRPSDIAPGDWDELVKTHSRNGMLMVMGCLLWWGDVAEESEDSLLESDWRVAVRDVLWALEECVVGVGELYVKPHGMRRQIADIHTGRRELKRRTRRRRKRKRRQRRRERRRRHW